MSLKSKLAFFRYHSHTLESQHFSLFLSKREDIACFARSSYKLLWTWNTLKQQHSSHTSILRTAESHKASPLKTIARNTHKRFSEFTLNWNIINAKVYSRSLTKYTVPSWVYGSFLDVSISFTHEHIGWTTFVKWEYFSVITLFMEIMEFWLLNLPVCSLPTSPPPPSH